MGEHGIAHGVCDHECKMLHGIKNVWFSLTRINMAHVIAWKLADIFYKECASQNVYN